MLKLPFFAELESARRVLIAGAGGGFDFMCGLPLFLALRAEGKEVHLANLTFSSLRRGDGERLGGALWKVGPEPEADGRYFPEKHASLWFARRGEEVPIYCIEKEGAEPTAQAYAELCERLSPDTLVLVDGGTDSLLRGDEDGLGTPVEDMLSILAARQAPAERKLLVSIGFGIDAFHGVCHAHVLEAMAELIRDGGYLGAFSLVREMPEAQAFVEALSFVHERMPGRESIVNSSIASALEGHFGNHQATHRTADSELFINPLMSLYFCFHLESVASRVLYLEQLGGTDNVVEASMAIEGFRRGLRDFRRWRRLPM